MTLSIKVPGATFTKTILKARPAVLDTAELFLFLGGSEVDSKRNRIAGKPDASVIGAPGYEDAYCTLNSANGFQAANPNAGSPFTYLAILSPAPTSDTVVYVGNWSSAAPRHALSGAGGDMRVVVDGTPRALIARSEGMGVWVARHDGSIATVGKVTGGLLSKVDASFAGGSQTGPFRAGGSGTGDMANTFALAAVVYWQDALSDADLADCADHLTGLLRFRGVQVS